MTWPFVRLRALCASAADLEVLSNQPAHDHAVRGCASRAIAQMAGFAGLRPQAWARLTLRGSFRRSFARPKPPAAACPVHRHLGGSFSLQPRCLVSVALHPVWPRRTYRPITAAYSQLGGRDFHSLDHRIHRRTPVPLFPLYGKRSHAKARRGR